MIMTQVAISGVALLGCLLLLAFANPTHARPDAGILLNSSELLSFDIPAQPMSDALASYSQLTGLSVLLDSDVVEAQAPAVHGALTRKQALSGLLAGSGLAAFFVNERFIVVRPPNSAPAAGAMAQPPLSLDQISGVHAAGYDHSAYVARVQHAVWQTLCVSPKTRPGSYRLAMQLWIGARGRLQRWKLLGSTGDTGRDEAIQRALENLSVGVTPSAHMPQPIVMLFVPASGHAMAECGTGTQG